MKQAKERLIFSNYGEMYTDDDIREILLENGNDNPTEEEINKERNHMEELDFEDALYSLKNFFNMHSVIAFGSVGRWNGTRKGAKLFDNFKEAYNAITTDCYMVKIYDENGHLFIHCSHHDGSITMELKSVTDSGISYYDRWSYGSDSRNEYQVLEQIIKRYSKIPHYCHKEWGCKVREYEPYNPRDQVAKMARSFY